MSQLTPPLVYQGFWIDHSHGAVLGSTITVESGTANVLIAVLSVLVAFAGSHLWDVLAFCYFWSLASTGAHDGVHHQRQFLLRNIASPALVLWETLKMMWQWRDVKVKAFPRLIALTIATAVCSAGFIVAGILSSKIISTTDVQVLAQSKACGFISDAISGDARYQQYVSYCNAAIEESITYTNRCYNSSETDPGCQIYTNHTISFDQRYVPCPFDGLCILQTNQALSMDTGLMWPNDQFGINAKTDSALAMRKVTTCAPLNVTRYQNGSQMDELHSRIWARAPLPNENMTNWYLGSWIEMPRNDTFVASSLNFDTHLQYTVGVVLDYQRPNEPFQHTAWASLPMINIIEPLSHNNSDLYLFLVSSNSMVYQQPVDDPLFSAHSPGEAIVWDSSDGSMRNWTVFHADDIGRMLGCTEQYQFCTSESSCTSLSDTTSALAEAANLELNPFQNATLYLYAHVLLVNGVSMAMLIGANDFPMRAKLGRSLNRIAPAPNQWEIEVNYWNAITLELMRKTLTDYAGGYRASGHDYGSFPSISFGPSEQVLCHAQKMKAPDGFSNISVLGLGLTLGLCSLIILINTVLTKILRSVLRRKSQTHGFINQWDRQELLQFQRIAYERFGIGSWTGKLHQVPITTTNESFECLTQYSAVSNTHQHAKISTLSPSSSGTEAPPSTGSSSEPDGSMSVARSRTM